VVETMSACGIECPLLSSHIWSDPFGESTYRLMQRYISGTSHWNNPFATVSLGQQDGARVTLVLYRRRAPHKKEWGETGQRGARSIKPLEGSRSRGGRGDYAN